MIKYHMIEYTPLLLLTHHLLHSKKQPVLKFWIDRNLVAIQNHTILNLLRYHSRSTESPLKQHYTKKVRIVRSPTVSNLLSKVYILFHSSI